MRIFSTLILGLCLSLFLSCKKKKDQVVEPVDPNAITSSYYFQADFDGTTKTFQYNVNGYTDGAGASGTSGNSGATSNSY